MKITTMFTAILALVLLAGVPLQGQAIIPADRKEAPLDARHPLTHELVADCQMAVSATDRRHIDSKLTAYASGECLGYVHGFLVAFQTWGGETAKAICPPHDITLGQEVRLFLFYADRHPEYAGEIAGYTVVRALQAAFACPDPLF